MQTAHPYANFLAALKQLAPTEAEQARLLGMPTRTLRNYKSANRMPFQIKRLMLQPKLMTALAADAEALAANRDAFQSPRTGEADQPADDGQ